MTAGWKQLQAVNRAPQGLTPSQQSSGDKEVSYGNTSAGAEGGLVSWRLEPQSIRQAMPALPAPW